MTKSAITRSFILIACCTAAGCASKSPSFGDSIQAEGKAVADLGEKWDDGQDMIKKGNKLIREGNEQVDEGNEDVAEGRRLVKSGERLVSDAETAYRLRTNSNAIPN